MPLSPRSELQLRLIFAKLSACRDPSNERNIKTLNFIYPEALRDNACPFDVLAQYSAEGAMETLLTGAEVVNPAAVALTLQQVIDRGIDRRLETVTMEELVDLDGVGFKTAAHWLLWCRPETEVVALDSLMLGFLSLSLPAEKIPKSAPANARRYAEISALAVDYARRNKYTTAQLDRLVFHGATGVSLDVDLPVLVGGWPRITEAKQTTGVPG